MSDITFWIAPGDDCPQGWARLQKLHPGEWYEMAFRGGWRGELVTTDTYHLYEGDTYHIGDEVYFVTADIPVVTGTELQFGDHVIEVSDPLLQDEGTSDTDGLIGVINCVGSGISCDVGANNVATITVPGATAGTSTQFVLHRSNLPTPTAACLGEQYFVLDDEAEYICINEPHLQADSTGTFNQISSRSDLSFSNASSLPDPTGFALGHYLFWNSSNIQSGGQEFYKVETVFSVRRWEQVRPRVAMAASADSGFSVEWLGADTNDSDALEFVPTLEDSKDYFYFNTSNNQFDKLLRTSFVGAGGMANHYQWRSSVGGLGALAFKDVTVAGDYASASIGTADIGSGAITYSLLTTNLTGGLDASLALWRGHDRRVA